MSELEQLVPSLDLCQKLKAVGFSQDTALVWWHVPKCEKSKQYQVQTALCDYYTWADILCSAPTAEEILTKLPACIEKSGVSYYLEVQITPAWGWDVDWTDDDENYLQPRGEEDCKQSIVEPAALAYLWWKARS